MGFFTRESKFEKERKLFMKTYVPYDKKDIIKAASRCHFEENETYIVNQELTCQHSIHEWNKYPRPGIKIEKLVPGDIVKYVRTYINGYGKYHNFVKVNDESSYPYEYNIDRYDAEYAMSINPDSLKKTWESMCREFDSRNGKVTIEYSLKPEELDYFVKCTKGVSQLGMWIFFPCDTCAEHANEKDKLWLHASLVRKEDMNGLI